MGLYQPLRPMVRRQNIGARWISVKAGCESHLEQYDWEQHDSRSELLETDAAQSISENRRMNRDEQSFLRRHVPDPLDCLVCEPFAQLFGSLLDASGDRR